MSDRPLAIDLFCGLGGWTEGLLAGGFDVIGFDIERHEYGDEKYPAQLVLQDVLTLHGSQFRDAALLVASPPCQEYSYMAMPWSKAKEKRRQYLSGERDRTQLTALFDACFRIQREACAAAGRYIPLVVENVKGAQEWVGRSRWNFGSFHLWGDVPALMPIAGAIKGHGGSWFNIAHNKLSGAGNNPDGRRNPARGPGVDGFKSHGLNWSDQSKRGQDFTRVAGGQNLDGIKQGGDWFDSSDPSAMRRHSSKSKARKARKAASARIAKIPFVLSSHIASVYYPQAGSAVA